MTTNTSLVFQNITFDIVDHNDDVWLRANQIGAALGYGKGGAQSEPTFEVTRKVRQLYERHADEFTDSMTALIKLPTAGGDQEVRIFSMRGAHLLAMFARTAIAKEFRRWVLDVLESIRKTGRYEIPGTKKSLPGKLTASSQDLIKKAVRERVESLPKEKWGGASVTIWSAIGTKFGTRGVKDGYKNIPEEALSEIMSLVARTPLSGEFIGKQDEEKETPLINIKAMMMEGMSDPTLPVPESLQRAINAKSFAVAHEFLETFQKHLAKRIAYTCEMGNPRYLHEQEALRVVESANIDTALTNRYYEVLAHIHSMSNSVKTMSEKYSNDIGAALSKRHLQAA